MEFYRVQARLAILEKKFKLAEQVGSFDFYAVIRKIVPRGWKARIFLMLFLL